MKVGRKPKVRKPTGTPYTISPKPPEWMSAAAKARWKSIVPGMVRDRRLTPETVDLVAAYCAQLAIADEAMGQVMREGLTLRGQKGTPVKHPALAIHHQAIATAGRLAAELGITRGPGDGQHPQGGDPAFVDL